MTLTFDFTSQSSRPGYRLDRLEVFNWGTFDGHVWGLDLRGGNTLLTGDIGSGKSTLVDAITTLLVPPNRLTYNKAAGAESKERTLRSYVLGYFKSERNETSGGAKAVSLRTHDSYSVLLARFVNESLSQTVTLAQVFWSKEVEGLPARMFVVADEALTIGEHFADFGSDIRDLRKRLRRSKVELFDSFPPYATAFRRRFGIQNEQALELFHQTVSMKSVGNLTDFVRQHMLEPFPVERRIQDLIGHFENLNRAHEAVLKARAQIEKLAPLVEDCQDHATRSARVEELRSCREALHPWFSQQKAMLLEKRLERLDLDLRRFDERIRNLEVDRQRLQGMRDDLNRAIANNGGDRLEYIKSQIKELIERRDARRNRAAKYAELATKLGLRDASDAGVFIENQAIIENEKEATEARQAEAQNAAAEHRAEFLSLRKEHEGIVAELESLRRRRSNIPARMLALRERLCDELGLEEASLPFAGEVLQVRDEERDWEGAIERLVHNFGLSMLVPDELHAKVATWVDRTHLGERLVYYRVRPTKSIEFPALGPNSLVRKLAIKPDSAFYVWLESEIRRRFDYACCESLEDFRRAPRGITRAGQIKDANERHEKDDRHRIDDRSRYVLGWSNEQKIAAFEKERSSLEARMQNLGGRISELQEKQKRLFDRLGHLSQLAFFTTFGELDWKPLASQIDTLDEERRRIESESDVLRTLQARLKEVDDQIDDVLVKLSTNTDERGKTRARQAEAQRQIDLCKEVLDATPEPVRARFGSIGPIVDEALGEYTLTIESCDNREKEVREHLQRNIDKEDLAIRRLVERIVQAMRDFCRDYPLETREMDSKVEAAAEYRAMLDRLRTDDLPRFERRFKELLNENTIREVANFQSQLRRERESILERIGVINASLRGIDYNPGRYIVLEAVSTTDAEIRDFQQELRACTEGTLTGSDDDAYSEAKFQKVKQIIERFRGREGTSDLDMRWKRKVTDVRNWFVFSASERWRETDAEHEHYTDSGGKSGGQKEKLAYTVLAASLAYQFGLEEGSAAAKTFRFVVIDEAFGRGSDESSRYGLELFGKLGLQLLIVTPLQKIHVIEPYVTSIGFVHNEDGRCSMVRNLTIEQYREERKARIA